MAIKAIFNPGRNCQGRYEVTDSGLLIDGRTYFKAFYGAALRARRYILLAGWQFDSTVRLIRGEDEKEFTETKTFLAFLNDLCERRRELEVYILAWDFSALFAIKREWFQDLVFDWNTNERLRFRFDGTHAIGASHHQKFAVIDGNMAFVGGMDICSHRWDDSRHLYVNPERTDSNGSPYEPYHDIQSFLSGPVALQLAQLFKERWRVSGGGNLALPSVEQDGERFIPDGMSRLGEGKVALSRTQSRILVPQLEPAQEVRNLYRDAIMASEKLIYLENQYFSSRAVFQALTDRMKNTDRSKLQIVLILPKKPHTLVEELSIGTTQVQMLQMLKQLASEKGHSFGVYYTLSRGAGKNDLATYIHAKMIIVDDVFLSVGSANATNRSMGLDTELNVSWATGNNSASIIGQSIQKIRENLLMEHMGERESGHFENISKTVGLVDFLDSSADRESCRLRRYTPDTVFGGPEELKDLDLASSPIDPEQSIVEESVFEVLSRNPSGFFSKGIVYLNEWLMKSTGEDAKKRHDLLPGKISQFIYSHWIFFSIVLLTLVFIIFWLRYG